MLFIIVFERFSLILNNSLVSDYNEEHFYDEQ